MARPRLIYISPLPPVRSGIADYSARVLRELGGYYDIDLVIDQPTVSDSWVLANFRIRSLQWFEQNAADCERRLYHFGNSPYHVHMFAMLQRYPGIVMLHDSWLGAARNWMSCEQSEPDALLRLLHASHGYAALIHDRRYGRESTLDTYPINLDVIHRAHGLLVHSHYAIEQARRHYGDAAAAKFRKVPFPKSRTRGDRRAIRRMLGIGPEDFLVCSFGMLAPTKLNQRLLATWLHSPLAGDERCHLVFVGENHGGDYGQALLEMIRHSGNQRIRITGFTSAERYADFLAAADAAVQLRTNSRGETSAAIFDVLAQGLPLIVNAHGSATELVGGVALTLTDAFSDDELGEALLRLRHDELLREKLHSTSIRWIDQYHHPAEAAAHYVEAIERFMNSSVGAEVERLRPAMDEAQAMPQQMRGLLEGNLPYLGRPRIYVDVTAIARNGLHTGIERVVRGILLELFELMQEQWRIEPVRIEQGRYIHATGYALDVLGLPAVDLPEEEALPASGDLLLGLDWVADALPANYPLLDAWRMRGVRMLFVVYDLLPVQRPDWFPEGTAAMHERWLQCIGHYADGLLCISRCVADDARAWFSAHPPRSRGSLKLGYFHPGSDMASTRPSLGLPEGAMERLSTWRDRRFFLMVGTVEPRKGHGLVIDAFEQLWCSGEDASLVIVGRQGWMSEALEARIRQHRENDVRLFWLEQASDEYLERLYDLASALIAASEAEGFGLPLVEAASRGLPVIARDIPVFREVSAAFADYFDGSDPRHLAETLRAALVTPRTRLVPEPSWASSWRETTGQLWNMLIGKPSAQWLEPWKSSS